MVNSNLWCHIKASTSVARATLEHCYLEIIFETFFLNTLSEFSVSE